VDTTEWRKSSYSGGANDCVEVRTQPALSSVRDTKYRDQGHLSFAQEEWTAALAAAKE
jgi:hypothetical protein